MTGWGGKAPGQSGLVPDSTLPRVQTARARDTIPGRVARAQDSLRSEWRRVDATGKQGSGRTARNPWTLGLWDLHPQVREDLEIVRDVEL
ncbi:MAG: hypothetical protein ACO395_09015, partial [Pontimonas sp.]